MAGTETRQGVIPRSPEEAYDYAMRIGDELFRATYKRTHAEFDRHPDSTTINQAIADQGRIALDLLLFSDDYDNPLGISMTVRRGKGEILHDYSRSPSTISGIKSRYKDFEIGIPLNRLRKDDRSGFLVQSSLASLAIAHSALGDNLHMVEDGTFTERYKADAVDDVISLSRLLSQDRLPNQRPYVGYVRKSICRDRLLPMEDIQAPGGCEVTVNEGSMTVKRYGQSVTVPLQGEITPIPSSFGRFTLPLGISQY